MTTVEIKAWNALLDVCEQAASIPCPADTKNYGNCGLYACPVCGRWGLRHKAKEAIVGIERLNNHP